MLEQYGTRLNAKPEGMLRRVIFPNLGSMDSRTGDGRKLLSSGKGTRELPRTLYAQFAQTSGHDGAVVVGRIDVVSFADDGTISGEGWMLDDDNGRRAAFYVKTKAMHRGSLDLAEVKGQISYNPDEDALEIDFSEWKVAAYTLVGKPAFADTESLLDDDEIQASLESDEPLIVADCDTDFRVNVSEAATEIVADSGQIVQPWDAFHQSEPPGHRKLTVDANGWVSGHLGLWDSVHDGMAGRIRIPRPRDGYASFNKPGVLTERGLVETGPIFLEGGHSPQNAEAHTGSAGDIKNAWCDVRIVEGKHGPWLSGIVRPGIDEAKVYAARASRISGRWVGDRLKAIVSVNAEGFDVPGAGFAVHEFSTDADGHLLELVASFDVDHQLRLDLATAPAMVQQRLALELALDDDDV
jgi:hypothetical protein